MAPLPFASTTFLAGSPTYSSFKVFFVGCGKCNYNVPFCRACTRTLYTVGRRESLLQLLSTASRRMTTVQDVITQKLTKEFKPVYLDVINESFMHNVPKGSETHFKVVVVSANFNDKPLIQRHRMVNETLKEELATGVHALSIQAKTPQQWESSEQTVPKSPPCLGGSAR